MAKVTRFSGSYLLQNIDTSDYMQIDGTGVTISGDLTVMGTTTSVESTNTEITDNIIVLNNGEAGAGVTLVTAGIEIDRGSENNVQIRYNDSLDYWELTNDGTTYQEIATGTGSGISRVKDDTTPELGGALSTNGFNIQNMADDGSSYIAADMILDPGANQSLQIENGALKLDEITDPSGEAGYTKLYAKAQSGGGTGLYFANTTTAGEELVSKSKAIVFGLIF